MSGYRFANGMWCRAACTAALLAVGLLAGPAAVVPAAEPAGPALAPYERAGDLSGTLTSKGSDTLGNLMPAWAQAFSKLYPNVTPQIESKGSATAPPALTEGTALLGPMSRKMTAVEEEAFEAKRGFRPTRIDVALDCLAVYVHKDNPARGFTLAQLDSIFSKTRKRGFADVTTWGQAGLTDNWATLPISLYGRNSASGTCAYFKEHVLLKGDYKDTVKEQPGSAGVVQSVAKDRLGIGYSGIGYRTSDVRAVPLAKDADSRLVEPTFENAIRGDYPIGRTLYVYAAKKPGEPLPPLVKEFLKFVLSKEGQDLVVKDGFGALPGRIVARNLKALE
jgi:phosphate transport system substrate-binding protein